MLGVGEGLDLLRVVRPAALDQVDVQAGAAQFEVGRPVNTSELLPGDRLYFIDNYGKIFHTGIAITPTHFVHSSPPAVQISSLRKGDRLYGTM